MLRTVCSFWVVTVVAQQASAGENPQAQWQVPECTCRIELVDTRPAEHEEVFFLDLAKVGDLLGGSVDTASMRLLARGVRLEMPFSLDWRYGERPPAPDEYVRPITGDYGDTFPATEGKLRRLGYLSFRSVPGETRYGLYFNILCDGRTLRERPNPNVRAWWVEAVTDPHFCVDNNHDGKPDLYAWSTWSGADRDRWGIVTRQDGTRCLKLDCTREGSLFSQPGLLSFDHQAAGRRIVYYQQLYAEQELRGRFIAMTLPNAHPNALTPAVRYSFGKIPPKQWQELCVEGRVRSGSEVPVGGMVNTYSGPCWVSEIHLQFPPERSTSAVIGCESDVAETGDEVELTWHAPTNSYFFRLALQVVGPDGRKRTVEGQRVEEWPEGFSLDAMLLTLDGKPVVQLKDVAAAGVAWTGVLQLGNTRPGRYKLRFEVRSRRTTQETVARLESDLRILAGPFAGEE